MTRHMAEDVRREQILDAARRAFVESGYMSTRMEDIAREAGLSKGGVYFHFRSKLELFDALVQKEYDRSLSFLETVNSGEASVAEKLETLGRFFPSYFESHPDTPRFFVVMGEVALREQHIREKLRNMQTSYLQVLGQVLEGGIASGEVRPVNTQAVALMLKSLMDGIEGTFALGMAPSMEVLLSAGMEVLLNGLLRERKS